MASKEQSKQALNEFTEIIRELLAGGNWEASLFLRTAHKKLQEILDEAVALSARLENDVPPDPQKLHQDKLDQGFVLVYVSIYQSDPLNLTKWETTLKSIREYSVTRPIYRVEDHAAEAIRSKLGSNEAYASVYIKPSDIIPAYAGKKIEDRWGHELLTIRGGCLLPSNIVEFVHLDRKYSFKNGKLLLKSDS
jgi:Dot/Icm secretion system protein IcmQ